jgi:hypothetical protein
MWPYLDREGVTTLIGGVFDGPAVKKVCRLLRTRPLSTALASKPKADLAVLLSDRVYADLGGFGQYLPAEEVASVEICDPSASSQEVGWLLVPSA